MADHQDERGYQFLKGGISNDSGPTLTSTVTAAANESLNGTVLVCRAGGRECDSVYVLWVCL